MAVGDVVNNITSVAASGTLDIQPGAGAEWVIHNIYVDSAVTAGVDIQYYDGANVLTWMSAVNGPLLLSNMAMHVTNSIRLRVKNLDGGSARLIGYDGVVTK